MATQAPRLPVIATIEEAMRNVARLSPSLLIAYLLPWLAVEISTAILLPYVSAERDGLFRYKWAFALKDAPLLAVFGAAALRMDLKGERPSKAIEWWWNGVTWRFALVLLAYHEISQALETIVLIWWSPHGVNPALTAAGWSEPERWQLYQLSWWLLRLAKLAVIALIYGQAAVVVARGEFSWTEHRRLLEARPVKLLAIVLLSAILIYGLELFWAHVLPWFPRPNRPNYEDWRQSLTPALETRLRWLPVDFLRDSFMVMVLAATYRRLTPAALALAP